jgi:hypothetical protein
MSTLTVAQTWASFEAAILAPIQASAEQRLEMKKAFYAGVIGVLSMMDQIAELDEDPACEAMSSIQQECMDFANSLAPDNDTTSPISWN